MTEIVKRFYRSKAPLVDEISSETLKAVDFFWAVFLDTRLQFCVVVGDWQTG